MSLFTGTTHLVIHPDRQDEDIEFGLRRFSSLEIGHMYARLW